MEHVKQKSLKTEFFTAVSVTLLSVALVSSVTVYGCRQFQKWLLPERDYVMLNIRYRTQEAVIDLGSTRFEVDSGEPLAVPYISGIVDGVPVTGKYDLKDLMFSVESLDYGIGRNGPRRRLAYIGAGIAMGALPAAYSVAGFVLCALWFYRKKLSPAITVLDEATRHISQQDLDFTVSCGLGNELGRLCRSFEEMRRTLKENHQELWKMIEERKLIQASIAHDLRNPIAIIEGYTEYLQLHLQTNDLTTQRLQEIVGNIDHAAKRLGQYTESVREIDQLDHIEIHREQVSAGELISDLTADLTLMASEAGKNLSTTGEVPSGMISVDASILYRILENILGNALRFAREKIDLSFALQNKELIISVADDGQGFSEEIRKGGNGPLMPRAEENGHRGMGLTISRILCGKHGGRLELANRQPHGAMIKIILGV